MRIFIFFLVISTASWANPEKEITKDAEGEDREGKIPMAVSEKDIENDAEGDRDGKILVAVSRTFLTSSVQTSTQTVLSTCIQTVNPMGGTCRRKRRKRLQINYHNLDNVNDGHLLDSSLDELGQNLEEGEHVPVTSDLKNRVGKFILWTSTTTTVIIVSTSTDVGTTVSVSFACTFSGLTLFNTCVAG